eukprot:scaffold7026_cov65-Phaeocystis_antarctica.AAC.12
MALSNCSLAALASPVSSMLLPSSLSDTSSWSCSSTLSSSSSGDSSSSRMMNVVGVFTSVASKMPRSSTCVWRREADVREQGKGCAERGRGCM